MPREIRIANGTVDGREIAIGLERDLAVRRFLERRQSALPA
jgi:hypothetical protein